VHYQRRLHGVEQLRRQINQMITAIKQKNFKRFEQ